MEFDPPISLNLGGMFGDEDDTKEEETEKHLGDEERDVVLCDMVRSVCPWSCCFASHTDLMQTVQSAMLKTKVLLHSPHLPFFVCVPLSSSFFKACGEGKTFALFVLLLTVLLLMKTSEVEGARAWLSLPQRKFRLARKR